jgi:hypothetical protein
MTNLKNYYATHIIVGTESKEAALHRGWAELIWEGG